MRYVIYISILVFIGNLTIGMQNHPMTRGAKRKTEELQTYKTLTPEQATQQLQTFIKKHRIFPSNPYTLEELKALITQGADVNTQVNLGTTALMRAAAYGNIEAMQVLIDAGADVDIQRSRGKATALSVAIQYEHLPAIELLIHAGANLDDALDCATIHTDNPKIAKVLLDAGALPDTMIVQRVLTRGFFNNIFSNNRKERAKKYQEVWQMFVKKYPKLQLTSEQATQKLQDLANAGFPHTTPDELYYTIKNLHFFKADFKRTETLLLHATTHGNVWAIQALLDAGIDINVQNTGGSTSLSLAIIKQYSESVKLLLEEGAIPCIPDVRGSTAHSLANATNTPSNIKDIVNAYAIMNRLS